jgi:hypothetical protein
MTGLFIPEVLTPLSFTPLYAALTEAEKLAYNRAHGRYFLEQTIFFEQVLGKPVLSQLIRMAPDERLAETARQFIADENLHTAWFRALLRDVSPETYARRDFHLLAVPVGTQAVARLLGRAVRFLPCLLWLQLIAEERSQYFGNQFIEHGATLDRRFLAVQRRHMEDEAGHILSDETFIEWLWPRCGKSLRSLNARLLKWALREFFHLPKRSGWRVVEHWLRDQPELLARRAEFRVAMTALGENDAYLRTLYPRKWLPRTCALAARWPELQFLEDFFTEDA